MILRKVYKKVLEKFAQLDVEVNRERTRVVDLTRTERATQRTLWNLSPKWAVPVIGRAWERH